MLIIFDLDDTLVQTTHTLTPHLLENAVVKMQSEGLYLPDLKAAVAQIQEIDRTSPGSKKTLQFFLKIHGGGEKFLEIGLNELNKELSPSLPLKPMGRAQEILESLSRKHLLAVVSSGVESRQRAKMEKAGIEPSLFSKIIVCCKTEKEFYYQALAREMKVAPSEVLVCGDRIEVDLLPAKKLGFTTVHIRQGRGEIEPLSHEAVDFSITKLSEIQELVCATRKGL